MSFLRKCSVLLHPRCSLITSQSLTARISTTVTTQKSESPNDGQPYPFMSKFREDKHRVEDTFKQPDNYQWKYQPHVMLGSCAIFLFYFLVWREEHDIDIALSKHMYQAMPGLEEQDLRRNIKRAKKKGRDTQIYEDRLNELTAQRSL